MHESLVENLSRFTPDGSALDRDALLFAAGQASVRRPVRTWGVLVGTLAACQLLTLVLLWPQSKPDTDRFAEGPPPAAILAEAAASADLNDPTSLQTLTQRLMKSQDGDLPREASSESLVTESPPLRASSAFIAIE
jgi:hypothetical protein